MHGGRAFLAGVAIGAVTMSAIGLVASGIVESPLQVAARTAPPAPSVLTATVRRQVLRSTIVFRGRVTAGKSVAVSATAPYAAIIVTKLAVRAGRRVRPGQLLAEIDGRPIFVLRGTLPAYRDLHEGDTGPDVAQLQRALERLGYADFDAPGRFGESTELAVTLFYQHLGYAAPADRGEPGRPPARPGPGPPTGPGSGRASAGPGSGPRPAGPGAGRAAAGPGSGRAVAEPAGLPQSAEVYLPMSEVSYIPARSALVVSVNARVGQTVPAGPVLRLATGEPSVTGRLGRYQARLVRAGMTARISSASPPVSRYGVVTSVGSYPVRRGQVGTAGGGYPVVIAGLRPLPQRLIGTPVLLTLLLAATSRPVLAVPVAAITAASNGAAEVIKLASGGRRIAVRISTGISAGGLVAVRPAPHGKLAPEDRVLIGLHR